ncbi:MAG: hypothetical protein Sapg2KO_29910 [Saprospiraceae bacterium]
MNKKVFTIVFFLLVALSINAQREETLFGSLDMTGAWYTSTQNFSFFEDDSQYFGGGSVDLEFGKSLYIGWAWNRMRDDALIVGDDGTESFRLRHNGLNLAYAPNSNSLIHPRFGVYAGGGRLEIEGDSRDRVFGVTPSIGAELNIASWFRLGLEGGYRFITDVDARGLDSADFSTPFAQIQLRFGFSWDY